ncbi:phage holin family protein [Bacillus sp. FJAT-45350]|uniref:phage holin family protein n=1 Tax=Bacillus sp. FJAT-45350 TaxID=2011014 RepID=UPI000BB89C83|nr:phage holin family protein [Bacillus sp. FJAT-45350]
MGWLVHLLVNSVALMVVAGYFTGFHLSGFGAAVGASVLLSFINFFIRPILILLTLPVTMVTLGFFMFVINGLMLMLTAALMGDAFVISSFGMALLAAIIIATLNLLIHKMVVEPIRKRK